ncbi:hypothetical protein [Nocardia sp. NBC_01327]|uniref:hypothetical protein n=1 Tax=Nocardia sp. NBC_01327 TaxID=2903593 RepID=UPI002E11F048|nr:hypothetical protein OG326_20015 [Nocardia sp. NBC_01327]
MSTRNASGFDRMTGSWLTVLLAAVVGPMAGIEIVLLDKSLGGVVGLPGAVVGYIALTAVGFGVVGVLPAVRWRLIASGRGTGGCGVLAGTGLVVAGAFPGIGTFTGGVLVAGVLMGPVLVAGLASQVRVRAGYAVPAAGLVGGALAAGGCLEHPGIAVLATGSVAVALGVAVIALNRPAGMEASGGILRLIRKARWVLTAYAATGFAVGAALLPALHLLLFRWNVLDGDHPWYLASAATPMVLVALLPGRHAAAIPSLLILAAGGALLVATAPGAWQSAVGTAVTLAAAVRCLSVLDSLSSQEFSVAEGLARSAVTVCTVASGGLAGLGFAAAAGHVWGTGSALTLSVLPVLAAALFTVRADPARDRVAAGFHTALVTEGGAR